MTNTAKYYYGVELSRKGRREGFVDQNTLYKILNGVMNCSILENVTKLGLEWSVENGSLYQYRDNDGNEYSYDEAQDKISELQDEIEELESKIAEIYEEDEDAEEIKVLERNVECLKQEMDILEEPEEKTIYSTYIISGDAAEMLCNDSKEELLLFCDALKLYVWCVTKNNCGEWENILTDIPVKE